MKVMRHYRWVVQLVLIISLSGCNQGEFDSPVTATSIPPTDPATTSPTQTSAPTVALIPSATPTPDLPPLYNSSDFNSTAITTDFIFDGLSEDCNLPCWHDLRIGQSDESEISVVFSSLLNRNIASDLFVSNPPIVIYAPQEIAVGGPIWTGNSGGLENGLFRIDVYYERESTTLRALQFRTNVPALTTDLSPQRFIRQLGPPSTMLMDVYGLGMGYGTYTDGALTLHMMFDDGIVITAEVLHYPVNLLLEESGHLSGDLNLCLGGELWEQARLATWDIILLEPTTTDLDDLPPVQDYLTNRRYLYPDEDRRLLQPLSDYLPVSLETIADAAIQEGDACFSATVSTDIR